MIWQQIVAIAVTAGLFGAICIILYSRGLRIVVGACLFVASLVSTQLSVKVLVSQYDYKFPGFLTVLHFTSVWLVCAVYWIVVGEPRKLLPCSIGSCGRWCRTIIPIALSQPVSVVFNNKAMVFVGAGVCAIIGTLSPVSTAVLSRIFGRKLAILSWFGIFVAFIGALTISWGELEMIGDLTSKRTAIVTGLAFAFASLFGRSTKIVVIDFLLTPLAYFDEKSTEPLSLLHVYVLAFPMGALMSGIYSWFTEDIAQAWTELTTTIAGVIFVTCMSAIALNFLGGFVLKELGASAQQIIGKLNTICIAGISVAFLGEHLPWVVLLGTVFVLSGVAIFEQGERSNEGVADKLKHDNEDEDSDEESCSESSDSSGDDNEESTKARVPKFGF